MKRSEKKRVSKIIDERINKLSRTLSELTIKADEVIIGIRRLYFQINEINNELNELIEGDKNDKKNEKD